MTESKQSPPPMPPPPKEGESVLEYSIRISGDKRTPEQIKQDSENSIKDEKNAPPEKPATP